MFCRDFEKISGDLAAGRLMEASKRERAFSHASECSACALRLKAERTLDIGLRALGKDLEGREAPAHLKTALRSAFDRQSRTPAVLKPVLIPAGPRYRALQWAAALIVIAVGAALILNSASTSTQQNISDRSTNGFIDTKGNSSQSVIESGNKIHKEDKAVEKTVSHLAKKKPTENRRHRASSFEDIASSNENVTEYIPLTYLADSTAMESGTVLRVELPTSALVSMGLPAPIDRGDLKVKADVIIGDDGVTRAVRLVGQPPVRR